jgi:nitric oxide reductase subunit B
MIGGFSVLSFVTVLTYTNAPPIPEKAVDAAGDVVFTGADIQKGQEVFFKYGLMEHGSLWGYDRGRKVWQTLRTAYAG